MYLSHTKRTNSDFVNTNEHAHTPRGQQPKSMLLFCVSFTQFAILLGWLVAVAEVPPFDGFFVLHMHSFLQVLKLCLTCSGGVVVVVGPQKYPLKYVHYATLIVCSVLQCFSYFFLRQSIFNAIIHCLSTFRRHSTDDQDLDLISNTSGSYKRDNFIFRIWNFKRKVSQNIVH